jgi:hypothetical protein
VYVLQADTHDLSMHQGATPCKKAGQGCGNRPQANQGQGQLPHKQQQQRQKQPAGHKHATHRPSHPHRLNSTSSIHNTASPGLARLQSVVNAAGQQGALTRRTGRAVACSKHTRQQQCQHTDNKQGGCRDSHTTGALQPLPAWKAPSPTQRGTARHSAHACTLRTARHSPLQLQPCGQQVCEVVGAWGWHGAHIGPVHAHRRQQERQHVSDACTPGGGLRHHKLWTQEHP